MELWSKIKASGSGEPGLYFSNNADWGTNPCCEIALRPFQFCNLTEINGSDIVSQGDLEDRSRAAAFLGTLQAGYTDFHYLRDIWKKTTEKDSLIGVGITGIASGNILNLNLESASNIVKQENERVATIIGINVAARTTCIKPSGTTSLVVGSSSGIHAWHSEYYIRNIRFGKNETIYKFLAKNHPEIVQDEFFKPMEQAVIGIPVKAPQTAIFRTESAIQLLERIKKFSSEWVKVGHRKGDNTHNVSATISVGDTEWDNVAEWMWDNRDCYNGLSVLPRNDHSYQQPPFEECSKERFDSLYATLKNIDLTKVIEQEDNTDLSAEAACAGGACEVNF
jgi:ribonucleoside-diphosphate reductase alpha chain